MCGSTQEEEDKAKVQKELVILQERLQKLNGESAVGEVKHYFSFFGLPA